MSKSMEVVVHVGVETRTDEDIEQSPLLRQVLGDAYTKLVVFHQKLQSEAEPRGLIGPRDVDIIWDRHILNSTAVVPFIQKATHEQTHCTVADVGSGGGFPGLVAAACLPDQEFSLIEPMERRCEWLEECVSDMGLDNVSIIRARAEDVIHSMKKGSADAPLPFNVVTCRAVAPMRKLVPWALPLLVRGGSLIAIKGRSAYVEVEKAQSVIRKFHGVRQRVEVAPVMEGVEPTHVVIVERY